MPEWNYTDAQSDGKDAQKPQVSSLCWRAGDRGRQSSAETGWLD